MGPAVPWSGKDPTKHTHIETLYTHPLMCTHQTNNKHWFRTELTRSHDSNSFHSWLPINSIIVQKCFLYPRGRALDGRHEYVATCCYGNPLLGAIWVRIPHRGNAGGIDSRENKEDFFFFLHFSFCCRGEARAEGKSPSSAFQSTSRRAPLYCGTSHNSKLYLWPPLHCHHCWSKWVFGFFTVNTTTSLYLN